jgi:hypothetical protein
MDTFNRIKAGSEEEISTAAKMLHGQKELESKLRMKKKAVQDLLL